MKWVKVSEQLPEETHMELLLLDGNNIFLGIFIKNENAFYNVLGFYREYCEPEYWIPLQDLPRPKD